MQAGLTKIKRKSKEKATCPGHAVLPASFFLALPFLKLEESLLKVGSVTIKKGVVTPDHAVAGNDEG